MATMSYRVSPSTISGKRELYIGLWATFLTLGACLQAPAQTSQTLGRETGKAPSARAPKVRGPALEKVCAPCIRAHMEFLASDALQGRGSASPDELIAATYIASQLRQYGVAPAGDDGSYIQKIALVETRFAGPPQLKIAASTAGSEVTWTHGNEFLGAQIGESDVSGPLQKMAADSSASPPQVERGAFVLLETKSKDSLAMQRARDLIKAGASAVLVAETPSVREHWKEFADRLLSGSTAPGGDHATSETSTLLVLSQDAFRKLNDMPAGTQLHLTAPREKPETTYTWNAVGMIRGTDPILRKAAVLFSAHLDHLGVGEAVNGDSIYNGADDDASGVTAVLELARVLGSVKHPKRTVIFALFGSEESGGFGSTGFREHPPVPLADIAANLEFEMIGRSDTAVADHTLWLTGWERSNLGPELASHGARLVRDPHPDQNFFARSDNYVLAKKGVVAQTISSYGMHKQYHQPSDDLAHIDFGHMEDAIGSLLGPVEWLVNSGFRPQWVKGGKP
jgi:peptidase M28-like protein